MRPKPLMPTRIAMCSRTPLGLFSCLSDQIGEGFRQLSGVVGRRVDPGDGRADDPGARREVAVGHRARARRRSTTSRLTPWAPQGRDVVAEGRARPCCARRGRWQTNTVRAAAVRSACGDRRDGQHGQQARVERARGRCTIWSAAAMASTTAVGGVGVGRVEPRRRAIGWAWSTATWPADFASRRRGRPSRINGFDGRRQHVPCAPRSRPASASAATKLPLAAVEPGDEEVADRVAVEFAGFEAVLEGAGEQRVVVGERAAGSGAGRPARGCRASCAEASGAAPVVGHRHDGGDPSGVGAHGAQRGGEAVAAAEGDDVRAVGPFIDAVTSARPGGRCWRRSRASRSCRAARWRCATERWRPPVQPTAIVRYALPSSTYAGSSSPSSSSILCEELLRRGLAEDVVAHVGVEAGVRAQLGDPVRVRQEPAVEHEVGVAGQAVAVPEATRPRCAAGVRSAA